MKFLGRDRDEVWPIQSSRCLPKQRLADALSVAPEQHGGNQLGAWVLEGVSNPVFGLFALGRGDAKYVIQELMPGCAVASRCDCSPRLPQVQMVVFSDAGRTRKHSHITPYCSTDAPVSGSVLALQSIRVHFSEVCKRLVRVAEYDGWSSIFSHVASLYICQPGANRTK
jgi:hypothetical protein